MEEHDNDGFGDFSRKEDNNNSKNGNNNIVQCDKMGKESFNVQSQNSCKYKTTVHTEKGDIFMTCHSVDLLCTAKQLLEEGLKDKTVNEDSSELIYQNPELLELATSSWEKNVN